MSQAQKSEAYLSSPPMANERFVMEENKCYGSLKVAPQQLVMAIKIIVIATIVLICNVDSCCSCS